jgi:hypothetical protein
MEPYGTLPTYTDTVDYLTEANPEALYADGLEEACIGHTEIYKTHPRGGKYKLSLAVYSKQKIIKLLIERDGMTNEEAEEYAEYNIYSAYMGDHTPLYLDETYHVNL